MSTEPEKLVLSICDIHPLRLGSFEEYLIELSHQLMLLNYKHVIVFRAEPILSVRKVLLSYDNVDIRVFSPSRHSISNLISIYNIIRETNPIIVHFHFYPIFSCLNIIKIFTGTKFIYTDHMGVRVTSSKYRNFLRRCYNYLNFVLFSFPVDSIVCVSKYVKLKYRTEYSIKSKKLNVIYNGINYNRFSKKIDYLSVKKRYNLRDELVVSCIAGLREDKGVQCLVKAASSILEANSNIKFFIIGDGEYRQYLEELVSSFNLLDKFVFIGFSDSTEEFYSISSCIVVPSLVNEAFCFVAAEAIAARCPVVAFDSGAIKEVFGRIPSMKIIPQNVDLLAESIISQLRCSSVSGTLEEGSSFIKKYYSIETCVRNYMNLYFELSLQE